MARAFSADDVSFVFSASFPTQAVSETKIKSKESLKYNFIQLKV
jgi:hypothetical protein